MMDTKINNEPANLSTVADYVAAIRRVRSGIFISRLSET